jgi:hypothetical protein
VLFLAPGISAIEPERYRVRFVDRVIDEVIMLPKAAREEDTPAETKNEELELGSDAPSEEAGAAARVSVNPSVEKLKQRESKTASFEWSAENAMQHSMPGVEMTSQADKEITAAAGADFSKRPPVNEI